MMFGLGHGHWHRWFLRAEGRGEKKQQSDDHCLQRADMGRSVLRPYRCAHGAIEIVLTPAGASPVPTNPSEK